MRMLTGDTFVFWPKGRCQVWRCLDRVLGKDRLIDVVSMLYVHSWEKKGKSMEIDLGLIGRFTEF